MSAAPLASGRRERTETATARNRRVRREITAAMRAKQINGALCDFLQIVIDECHLETWAYHSRTEWAAIVGKSVSSIKLYIRVACEAGYLRKDAAGRLYVLGLEPSPDPLFLAAETGNALPDPDSFLTDPGNVLPPPSFNGLIQVNSGSHQQASAGGNADTIETGHAETADLLIEIGVYPETAARLSSIAPELVRATIDQADRCGRARDRAAFVAYVLDHGGVFGAAPRPHRRMAAPIPPADAREHGYQAYAAPPGFCTCGRMVPAEWHGHCPACYPEQFDPPPGGAP